MLPGEVRIILPIISQMNDGDGRQEEVQIQQGTLSLKQTYFTPKSLLLYDMAVRTGYKGDLSSYVNDSISQLYETRNVTVGLITKTEV